MFHLLVIKVLTIAYRMENDNQEIVVHLLNIKL